MSIDIPFSHPLFSYGNINADHKSTVADFGNILKNIAKGDDKELKALWDDVTKYSNANLNILKRGDKHDGKPDQEIGTTHHYYAMNVQADAYDTYFDKSDGKGGRDAFKEGTKQVLEREKLRYEYVKAVKESKEYKALPEDKRDEFVTEKLSKTYSIVDNGGHRSIDYYGSAKEIRELLEKQKEVNAQDMAPKKIPKEKPLQTANIASLDASDIPNVDAIIQALTQYAQATSIQLATAAAPENHDFASDSNARTTGPATAAPSKGKVAN